MTFIRALFLKLCTLVICLAVSCYGRSIRDIAGSQETLQKGLDYLKKYNFIIDQKDLSEPVDSNELEAAIRHMQMYMGPNVTVNGILDDATMAQMEKPRCGVPDSSPEGDEATGGRLRRYAHFGGKWGKETITYRILNAPTELSLAEVRDTVRRAFDLWQRHIPKNFVEVPSGRADIRMKFAESWHGDLYRFDGEGGTLAHAFVPDARAGRNFEGDVHFDDAEYFTIRSYEGVNLFYVAAHEIGHSLGLGHSTLSTALMFAAYQGYIPNLELSYDDILGIQALYGSRPSRPGQREQPAPEPTNICQTSFDSVAYIRGEIVAFKEDRVWPVKTPGEPRTPPEGYSTAIFFEGLPSGIQAAYERYDDQKILFFKGTEYWVYDGQFPLPGYPRPISDLSEALPDNIEAAVTLGENNKVYFFKDGLVYRYDELTQEVDAGWPYPISSVFPGVPDGLDGTFRYHDDDLSYFIKDRYYYKYSDLMASVIDPTPRLFAEDFFGCNPDL